VSTLLIPAQKAVKNSPGAKPEASKTQRRHTEEIVSAWMKTDETPVEMLRKAHVLVKIPAALRRGQCPLCDRRPLWKCLGCQTVVCPDHFSQIHICMLP
jgi:hypothetical protein